MDISVLFTTALGIGAPWFVSKVEFDEEKGRLDIDMDFAPGSQFACPVCGESCSVHDRRAHSWRHLNFFQHQTFVHAGQPRVRCSTHGVRQVEVPWARPGSGFTLLFESLVMLLVKGGMAVRPVAELVGEHDTRLWRIVDHYVQQARKGDDQSEVRRLAIDETSKERGHEYITVFSDADNGRVLFATEGKDSSTIGTFIEDFRAHGGDPEAITDVVVDMSSAFRKGLTEHLPNAIRTVDPFHVIALANRAVDEVRREEQKDVEGLKSTRWLWLKNEHNQSEKQRLHFKALRDSTLQTARAWRIKKNLQDIYRLCSGDGEAHFDSWYNWAIRSRLKPILRLAKTLMRERAGILSWFRSRLSNGRAEAINGLIQAAKRTSRGFRTTRNLVNIVYLRLGRLDLQLPNPLPAH